MIERTFRAVDEGDCVQVATASQAWKAPLDVTSVERTEWDVPFGDDWLISSVTVETSRGSEYVATIDTGDDVDAGLYITDEGEITRRFGPLKTFAPDIDVYPSTDPTPAVAPIGVTPGDDPEPAVRRVGYPCPECGEAFYTADGREMHVEAEHQEFVAPNEVPIPLRHVSKEDLYRETCLALGVKPPETTVATKASLTDLAARLSGRPKVEFVRCKRPELCDAIAGAIRIEDPDVDSGGHPRKRFLGRLHGAVVPEWMGDDAEWEQITETADVPDWLQKADVLETVGQSESVRGVARGLGWHDVNELRRVLGLMGLYDNLAEPERKKDSKYSVGAA